MKCHFAAEECVLASLTLSRLHTVDADFAEFSSDDAVCSREVDVPLSGQSHAAGSQEVLFVEPCYQSGKFFFRHLKRVEIKGDVSDVMLRSVIHKCFDESTL